MRRDRIMLPVWVCVLTGAVAEVAFGLKKLYPTAAGRRAPLTAGLAVAAAANLVLVLLISVVLIVLGLPPAGSVAFALGAGGCGLVFAALAAVAAQVSGTAGGARGMAIALLGVAFLLRGIGDSAGVGGPAWLSWLSPVGWAEPIRPFAGERWWVLGLAAGTAVVLGGAAFWLAARRDQGAGLVAPRPGPASAGRLLGGPLGLAWRLQRGNLAGWTLGLFVEGAAVGSVAKGIGALFGTNAQLRQVFERIGGQPALTSAYLAGVMSLAGLVAAAYAVSAVLRWAVSHLVVVVAGTALVLAAAGVGTGLFYGLRAGGVGPQVMRMLGAGLVQLPAALVVAGIAVALFGLLPGWSVTGGWLALGPAALIGLFGQALQLGQWLVDISPFSHAPKLPGGVVSAAPLVWLSVVAVALAAAGLAGLRHRDLA